jgi:hypothetical protein
MANTLGIPERTLAQISAASNALNQLGGNNRQSPYQPMTVRITDHADDTPAETSDPNKMALFVSRAHGHPWVKDQGLKHVVVKAAADPVANPTRNDVTVLYPNFDYSTF